MKGMLGVFAQRTWNTMDECCLTGPHCVRILPMATPMPEQCTGHWDPAAPTYQLALRDGCTQVDSVSAIEALLRQGVPPAVAAAAIKKAIDEGSALVQIIGADCDTCSPRWTQRVSVCLHG